MIALRVQRLLMQLYGLHHIPNIDQHLIATIPEGATTVVGHRDLQREAVFVCETGDGLEIGVYLDPAILKRLSRGHAHTRADDLSCVAEGVSHFIYLTDRYLEGRTCTPLELELQAEVDKFLTRALLTLESDGRPPRDLFYRQFEGVSYDATLSTDERTRYETANHFAAKFCHDLADHYLYPFRRGDLIDHVRPFFHEGLQEKIARVIP
ncbi:MAG: hypothetical protein HY465_01590 [Deltaproteobacteria bacterium]|nr:hypothetical protein [Deltaproteobacteria bacterium]